MRGLRDRDWARGCGTDLSHVSRKKETTANIGLDVVNKMEKTLTPACNRDSVRRLCLGTLLVER